MNSAFFVLSVVALAIPEAGSTAMRLSSPEEAIRTLEDAFVRKDIEAAVAAKDFEAEARLMIESINPEMVSDEILKKTAEVLELGFRKQIEADGFPDFTGLTCKLAKPVEVAENLVKVVEICTRKCPVQRQRKTCMRSRARKAGASWSSASESAQSQRLSAHPTSG